MNKEEQISALIGDKILDIILFEEMTKRMPKLKASYLIQIRHRLASNEYLARAWEIMYGEDFIDIYTVHQKGTMMEMQLHKAYNNGDQQFLDKCIRELLWYDIYMQFMQNRKNIVDNTCIDVGKINVEIQTKDINVRCCQTQTVAFTKTKQIQTTSTEIKTVDRACQTDIIEKQNNTFLSNLFKKKDSN